MSQESPNHASKNHHYVAKCILRNFCISGDTIFRAHRDAKGEAPATKNISKVFQRFHLNSLEMENGTRDDRLEKFFAYKLDNFVPDWIDVFSASLETGRIGFKTVHSKMRFVQFFYNHMKRTPDFIDPIVENVSKEILHENLVEEFQKTHRPLSNSERQLLDNADWRRRLISNSRVTNFSRQSENILDTLASMTVVVATPKRSSKQFIVASNPVARFEDFPNQRLGTKGVELWTTLTPKIAVGFAVPSKPLSVIFFDDAGVRKLNQTLTRNSTAIAGNCAKLLSSLSRATW